MSATNTWISSPASAPTSVAPNARSLAAEVVGVGSPAGGQEQVRPEQLPPAAEPHRHPGLGDRDLLHLRSELEDDPLVTKYPLDLGGHLGILPAEQMRAAI